MQDQHQSKIQAVLEKLQEESWQLELLISGFAIFLVAAAWDPLQEYLVMMQVHMMGLPDSSLLIIPSFIMLGSWFFLLANLILHMALRGLWISAIGVRYVAGDIDFETLSFAPVFDRYLRKRIPSFDHFIERLEKLCSVVFAFTFLIIFVIVAFGMFLAFHALVDKLLSGLLEPQISDTAFRSVTLSISILIAITALVYFIDFITLGWIKRRKKIARFYYPIYRFYSLITLSFLYRPLYYNLIGDKFGRRVALFLLPYMFIVATAGSLVTEAYLYFPDSKSDAELSRTHYADALKKYDILRMASIPSKYIRNGYLELFIPYTQDDDVVIEYLCSGIKADKKIGTRVSTVRITFSSPKSTSPDSLLLCVSQVNRIFINDSLVQQILPLFIVHPNQREHGLMYIIDIDEMNRGRHHVLVEKQQLLNDTLQWVKHTRFPFWKE